MIKNRFVIVATALAYLWAGAIIAEAADFRTLNGTWTGQVSFVIIPAVGVGASGFQVPATQTLTTRGEQHIRGTITFGGALTGSTGSIDGHAITPRVFFVHVVTPPFSGFTCGPGGPVPADSVISGIASIDDSKPLVMISTLSGTGFCGEGIFVTTTLNKQP